MIPRIAAAALLLLAACASTPTQPLAPAPPVKVVVTAAPWLNKLIDVAKITAETELALRRLAPSAAPATVTVNFTGTALMNSVHMRGAESHGNPEPVTYVHTLASFSRTPWLDGFQPVVATHEVPAAGLMRPGVQVGIQGTYRITDANGATLDAQPVLIEPGREQRMLAVELAKRVARIAHGS
jgi:hypothetical protein